MSGRGGTEVEEEVEGTRGHPRPWEVKRTVTNDDAEFVQDEAVTDVLVNGTGGVWIDRGRGLEHVDCSIGDQGDLRRLAVRLAAGAGRRPMPTATSGSAHAASSRPRSVTTSSASVL